MAQLLKAIATDIELREHGLGICRSVLKQEQVKLVSWSLSAPKHKEFVISPALRLLTEIVSFDGGTAARQLYSKRDFTFDAQVLARNLSLRKSFSKGNEDGRQHPTVRSNAVRYLLANLKFQNEGAKADILKQFSVVNALFDGIQDDAPPLIVEILKVLKSNVIQDTTLSRTVKGHVFSERNLNSLCQLYRADQFAESASENEKSVEDIAHEFMVLVCTQSEAGVLRLSAGWYPSRRETDITEQDFDVFRERRIGLDLDGVDGYDESAARLPVRNSTLADFLQTLRPYKSTRERELFLAILGAAPELVANYFPQRKTFPFDPKLTATWIGYASTLFEVVQLAVPQFFGKKDGYGDIPPPLPIVIENLLPRPLTQKSLTSCLNQASNLIRLFAVRIITIAFQKLREVLKGYSQAASGGSKAWEMAASRLLSEFGRRCPKMNDVVTAFRRTKRENLVEREAATRLLSLYYEVTPQVALDEKFDISVALASTLQELYRSDPSGDANGLKFLELDHLLRIARHSPGVSWWKRPEALEYTPFLTLANLASNNLAHSGAVGSTELDHLLGRIMQDNGLFHIRKDKLAVYAFLQSLSALQQEKSSLEFVDDCLQRNVRRPIKYEDDLDALIMRVHGESTSCPPRISLLLMTLVEQWSYVEKTRQAAAHSIANWLRHLIFYLRQAGEHLDLLNAVLEELVAKTTDYDLKGALQSTLTTFTPAMGLFTDVEHTEDRFIAEKEAISTQQSNHTEAAFDISILAPPTEDPKHTALTKWSTKDIATAVEDGHLSSLILLLSSSHVSIRRQALAALRQLWAKLPSSSYAERSQLYLLVGELLETAAPFATPPDHHHALPYLVSAFAARAALVLALPSHPLYAKLNAFLILRPAWRVPRLASYWCARVLLHPPEDDVEGAHWREVVWLLDWLGEGVRDAGDVEMLRKGGVFERVMAVFGHPSLRAYRRLDGLRGEMVGGSLQGRVRGLILRFVGRVALVEGGATTLVTRAGVIAWLDVVAEAGWVDEDGLIIVKGIREAILQRCERDRVVEWSAGLMEHDIPK